MKIILHFITVFLLTFSFGCANYSTGWGGPGLKGGTLSEEDMKADDWNRKDLVATIQSSLNELGYITDNQEGIEDISTQSAVLKYKAENGLEVNNQIDSSLEKYLDDSVWAQRNEISADPKELAKEYAAKQEELNCEKILGKDYKKITLNKPSLGKSSIYVYRYTPIDNELNVYPKTNIINNSENKGIISDNSFVRYEVLPGEIRIHENTNIVLDIEKRTEPIDFYANSGSTYFIRLLAGKYDGQKKYTQIHGNDYWPYWLVGGVAGFFLHQAFKNTVLKPTDETVKEKFYFADFIQTSENIGKCHIQAINKL